MELVIDRLSLANSLSLVQGIVERRNTVPILSHVLMESAGDSLQLTATDLEVGIRTQVACKAGKPGSLTLSARKLFEIVREAAGDEVSLKSVENDWVEIRCGRARFKMMGLDPRQFPAMPRQGDQKAQAGAAQRRAVKADLSVAASVLATMIDKTLFAVSPDETRYNLSGVYIESPESGMATMVATDGHRLSLIRREVKGFSIQGGVIIPRKGLGELRKLLDQEGEAETRLSFDGQLAWLKRGATEISMRLVEGEFPDYRGVIPKRSRHEVTVPRDELLAAVKRVAIFSSERFHGVKLALSAGSITVSSTSPDLGEASDSIDVDFKGEDMSIGFNASYVTQALAAIPPESQVSLGLTDEVSPGVITTPADTGFTYVVMPMRL
jgi:DNA polymerase-3 subunit beta